MSRKNFILSPAQREAIIGSADDFTRSLVDNGVDKEDAAPLVAEVVSNILEAVLLIGGMDEPKAELISSLITTAIA